MRKLLLVALFCLVPSWASAQGTSEIVLVDQVIDETTGPVIVDIEQNHWTSAYWIIKPTDEEGAAILQIDVFGLTPLGHTFTMENPIQRPNDNTYTVLLGGNLPPGGFGVSFPGENPMPRRVRFIFEISSGANTGFHVFSSILGHAPKGIRQNDMGIP